MAQAPVNEGDTITSWPNCVVCGKAVRGQTGFLSMSYAELHDFNVALAEYRRKFPPDKLAVEDVMQYPEPVRWRWGHQRCLPGNDYWIEASRIDTMRKALAWTLHLQEKNWFGHTDWESAIRGLFAVGSC